MNRQWPHLYGYGWPIHTFLSLCVYVCVCACVCVCVTLCGYCCLCEYVHVHEHVCGNMAGQILLDLVYSCVCIHVLTSTTISLVFYSYKANSETKEFCLLSSDNAAAQPNTPENLSKRAVFLGTVAFNKSSFTVSHYVLTASLRFNCELPERFSGNYR